ncbi:MAG TPA: bifunctional (p)ppGpp synthetase/guanosine-3',5'-bis(diphosphate) 3'-pyrophosphohydrolase [Oligoflexia bacterium]|nr:bifunctional (p)ppGpp synthetase/guanosine-3',5'-bis(diphosphate) 3'-pyrophosphohydrolase [Oligoflexia bacterium]HMP27466.1 bifunctional (p)ppGpp synthetase/guanosine-3',5'-bis(diphosphate) 3'-pyrophosphohydrolase [Oligoflexia bacterium]
MTETTANYFEEIAAAIQKYHPSPNLDLIKQAVVFAESKHHGQIRASGEPYITHPIAVALITCQLKLDDTSVIAAILHDTIEDTETCYAEVEKKFGAEVAEVVEGVTKLTKLPFESQQEKQAENFRKMLIAMSKDIRVILVKLADRLHNIRTLGYKIGEKQLSVARETLEIYAPIAARLGIYWVKIEMEDLALKYLRPEIYQQITQSLEKSAKEREEYIQITCKEIDSTLRESGISAAVSGRAKHIYSIWKNMEEKKISVDEIHDLLGFRIVVSSLRACYEALGIMHSAWKPVPGRFKDFIAMPKPNMYQSLHTTVIGPKGQRIEIQIRTSEMHKVAEEGVAAHWRYKEKVIGSDFNLHWVRELVESQSYLKNPDEFIQSVKTEIFPEEIFVFTPKGDLFRLPNGATAVDFAYAVHTDVGHNASGCKVNGQMVPLSHNLENGDTVEILTSKSHTPSKDWLRFVRTTKARQRIRTFIRAQEQANALAIGYENLNNDLRKVKLNLKTLEKSGKLEKVIKELGYQSTGEAYIQIGYGKLSTTSIIAKLIPGSNAYNQVTEQQSTLQKLFNKAAQSSKERSGIKVDGHNNILVRFARCCQPLPGDRIIGFITRTRGVVVHSAECPQGLMLDPARLVKVSWIDGMTNQRKVKIIIYSQDQIGLLANLTKAITDSGADIKGAQVKTTPEGKAVNSFEISLADSKQFEKIKRNIELVPGVIKVERVNLT